MNVKVRSINLAVAAAALLLTIRCTNEKPAMPANNSCAHATLGIEAGPLTSEIHSQLGLAPAQQGAIVTEVFAGTPAAAADIRRDDIVLQIGEHAVANECDFLSLAHDRSCDPVRVVVLRRAEHLEKTVRPIDSDRLLRDLCAKGNATACYRKAWLLARRNGTTGDKQGVLAAWKVACDARSADGCAYYGQELLEERGRAMEGIDLLQRSCDLGSGTGCANLAFVYARGIVIPRDDSIAAPLYERSCALGNVLGCYNEGLMAENGRGIARDPIRAVAAYGAACDGGSATACTNLGYLYQSGALVDRDDANALELYKRGCAGSSCQVSNLTACVNVGRMYRDGLGIAADPAAAAKIFDEACHRPHDASDVGDAAAQKARACSLLGGLYLQGTGVPADLQKGRQLSELGCNTGDSFGCFNAGFVYANGRGVARDPARAASLYEQGCKGGDGESCYDLSIAYENGSGVVADADRAADLKRKACDLGFDEACNEAE